MNDVTELPPIGSKGPPVHPIPASIDGLTPAWLTDILSEDRPGVVINDVAIDHVIHGTTSKICIVLDRNQVAIDAGLPDRMCLKVNWEAHASYTLNRAVWLNEGRFYRYMRPYLPAPAPAGYYASYDADTGQGLILMEDLRAQGARFGSNGEPLSVDQMAAALEDLGDLHAAWWDSPVLDQFEWLDKSMGGPTFVDRYGGAKGLQELIAPPERAATIAPEHQDAEIWVKAMNRLVTSELGSDAPRCLIHGDTHLGNSYYLPGSDTLRWLDWQLVRKGRPARELNYTLGCGLDIETRRKSEQDLIRHYLGYMKAKGIDVGSFDSFWRDYIQWPIWGFLCWAVTGDGWQPVPVIHETMRRFATEIDDYGSFRGL